MSKIMQLKISIEDIKPKIWRRFLVEDSISFQELHEVIQEIMGWENYPLWEFDVGGIKIGPMDEDVDYDLEDAEKIKLNKYLTEKQKFYYVYDFGDNWNHYLLIEKIIEPENSQKYPVCIAGERACPPEDCGGVWGYEELLKIRKDKNHPDYEEQIVEWLGEDFDPEKFNTDRINKNL